MKTTGIIATSLILSLAASVVVADDYAPSPRPVPSPNYYQHHASTAYEGWLRGQADLRRAWGEYNYNTSLARMVNQEAYRRYLENSKRYVETYFQNREMNREARARERGPRPTSQEIARNARLAAPRRLNSYQFQPSLGTVTWPVALRGDDFLEARTAVDRLLSERTVADSGRGSDNYRHISALTERMEDRLKSRIDSTKPMDYVAAKRFLTSLKYEASHGLELEGLASNNNR